MTGTRVFRAALGSLVLAAACEQAPTPAAPETPAAAASATAANTKLSKATSFTFTKIPAVFATHDIAAPVTGLQTIVFQMAAVQAQGMVVKQLGFMIAGSLQQGDVGAYQLVYYPDGPANPGVVLGTNDGSTWIAPGGNTLLYFDLASPITIPKGKSFTAYFGLRADVRGTGSFFFYARVQTCLVNSAGVDKDVAWFGGDLPLQGDQFNVN